MAIGFRQTELEFKTRGGKRKGAGRKPSRWRSSERHVAREQFSKLTPAHVTLRVIDGYSKLRSRTGYFAVLKATAAVFTRNDFLIVHISLERDHIHLLVEADDHVALERGVRAFEISAAQHLNRAFGAEQRKQLRGKVFEDRYHVRLIGSPTQARHCLAYVLGNWRHHDEDESSIDMRFWDVDYFSSAVDFEGWSELPEHRFLYQVPEKARLKVKPPKSWLLRCGWQKAGPISMQDVPGPRRKRRR